MKTAAVMGVALVGAAWMLHGAAQARAAASGPASESGGVTLDDLDVWGYMQSNIEDNQVQAAIAGDDAGNVAAFLSLIEWAEGTNKGSDPYRVCYGYRHTIRSFADHPAITGEWRGEPLDNLGPAYRGQVSTAAGRHQIRRQTWEGAKRALRLPDFSPASQDRAAVWLIKQRGALDAVKAGRIAEAVQLCRKEWASLPGAGYGQGERRLGDLIAVYQQAGGVLA